MNNQERKMRKVYAWIDTEFGPTREYLWAEVVSEDTARINNIPFFSDEVAYEDLVRVDEDGEVLEVLESTRRTWRATYQAASNREDAQREYNAICDHLQPFQIECESAVPGVVGLAVPQDVTDERLQELCAGCPVQLTLLPTEPAPD